MQEVLEQGSSTKQQRKDAAVKKIPTPIKAIRRRCIDCTGHSYKNIAECSAPKCPFCKAKCPLFPFRMGHGGRACLGPIRKYCLDCQGHSYEGVRECPTLKCALWPYRMGKRPKKEEPETQGLSVNLSEGEVELQEEAITFTDEQTEAATKEIQDEPVDTDNSLTGSKIGGELS